MLLLPLSPSCAIWWLPATPLSACPSVSVWPLTLPCTLRQVFPFLIGAGGVKKKGLERQTGTVLDFPRRDANGMYVLGNEA